MGNIFVGNSVFVVYLHDEIVEIAVSQNDRIGKRLYHFKVDCLLTETVKLVLFAVLDVKHIGYCGSGSFENTFTIPDVGVEFDLFIKSEFFGRVFEPISVGNDTGDKGVEPFSFEGFSQIACLVNGDVDVICHQFVSSEKSVSDSDI